MKTIIKKDIIEQYKLYVTYILICVFALLITRYTNFFGEDSSFANGLIAGMNFAYLNLIFAFDVKRDLNILIYPIKKEDVVRAKFVLFLIGGSIFFGLIITSMSLAVADRRLLNILILICFIYSLITLLLPFNIKFDGALRGIGIAVLILLQIGISFLFFYYRNLIENIVKNHIYIPIIVIVLIVLASYNLSIKFIRRKEF